MSWAKTKLQNLGAGPPPENISISDNDVESVDDFMYLGSLQPSDGQSRADMRRRISLAAATMNLERQAPIICNQNLHLPRPHLVSLALCIRNVDLTSCRRQVPGGVLYEVSATDTWHPVVRSHHQPSHLQQNRTSTICVSYQEPPRRSVWSHRQTTRQRPSSSGASNRHQPFTGSSTEPGLEASLRLFY